MLLEGHHRNGGIGLFVGLLARLFSFLTYPIELAGQRFFWLGRVPCKTVKAVGVIAGIQQKLEQGYTQILRKLQSV